MDKYQTFEYDVVVVGAGGAGLRAAIESSALGRETALVCKSLLGKAHTVMAEGGVAAALANVDTRDDWRVHFRDTMRGGKFLNQWRMAQIHAQEAPERVRELEEWGAVFDRTKDGRILQRNFGGHTYPRLAHVGDRTGLEMIRTLQDKGVHQGIDVHMECTIRWILKDGDRVAGCFGYQRESGRFVVFGRRRWCWRPAASGGAGRFLELVGIHGRRSRHGDVGGRRSDRHGVRAVSPDGHGLAAERARDAHYGGRARRGRRPGEQQEASGSCSTTFRTCIRASSLKRRTKPTLGASTIAGERPSARRPRSCSRATWWRGRFGGNSRRPRHAARRCVSRYRLAPSAEDIKRKLPSMYHQFKELADVDITAEPMEVGPTCHYMMGGVRVNDETQESTVPGLFAAGEAGGGMHGANRLGGNSLSDLLVFGKRAGEYAASTRQPTRRDRSMRTKWRTWRPSRFARLATGAARIPMRYTRSCRR